METEYGLIKNLSNENDSDPTYEAWKQGLSKTLIFEGFYSDPTYEAWKQQSYANLQQKTHSTPILPMRHGNRAFFPLSVSQTEKTPILPMRHGNMDFPLIAQSLYLRLRSYL